MTGDGEKPTVTSVLLDGNGDESGGGSVFESQLIHIGYEEENGEVLFLALPGIVLYFMLMFLPNFSLKCFYEHNSLNICI